MHSHCRNNAWAAAATLFVFMAGHTVLETARDSLFLARMPVSQLPWTYLSIAVMALLAAELNGRLRAYLDLRRWLALTLAVGAAGSFAFLYLFRSEAPIAAHAFYAWVAVVATLVLGQFWLLLSELFTVSDAKQQYGPITAGGLLGAIFGGLLARLTASHHDVLWLLVLGAGLLFTASLVSFSMRNPATGAAAEPTPSATSKEVRGPAMRDLRSERYLRRLLAIALLSTLVATLVDYNFKAQVARAIAPERLGDFFGTFNACMSGVALVVQLAIGPRLLTNLGVGRTLMVLPAMLTLASGGALALPGLVMAILIRGADGSLRYSLQRTSSEVLFMPLQAEARARWKMIIDVLGQRGGQALASGLILLSVALALPGVWMNLIIASLALAWLAVSASMERQYLALFRAKIKAGAVETRAEVPELDLHALESLVFSLGSQSDDEVLASIDLLVAYDRVRVIPSLLLYHPSRAVVLRTLEVLTGSNRHDFAGPARRLLERNDDEIRASAMLALTGQVASDDLRRELAVDLPIAARAAVLVAILAHGLDEDGAVSREVDAGCARGAPLATRLAFARAFRIQRHPLSVPRLLVLAQHAPPELARETARAMASTPDEAYVPVLLQMLDGRFTRPSARDALVAIGEPALLAVADAAADLTYPRRLRAHFPRTISRFDSAVAVDILLDRLDLERDGWVRFKIIRGLGQLRKYMRNRARARRVFEHARRNLNQAVRFMAFRISTERDHDRESFPPSKGGDLLMAVLRDKEVHSVDRAVRLVGLLHRGDEIHNIRQALGGRSHRLRAESLELLVHRVPIDVARSLLVLLDDVMTDASRLERAADALRQPIPTANYEERLSMMLEDDSEAVRMVAAYHVGELRLCTLCDSFSKAAARTSGMGFETFARVSKLLSDGANRISEPGSTLQVARRTP